MFVTRQLAVEPAGALTFGGQTIYRYNFHSLPGLPGWSIAYGSESGTAAERGWFLVDSKTHLLRRVFISAANIPDNLKLISLNALVDYEPETIAGHHVLLPSTAKVVVGEQSGVKRTSFLSFDHCRAFTAESAVTFEEQSAVVTQSKKTSGPPRLPPDLNILVSLKSPLSVSAAVENDVIMGTTVKPVFHHNQKLIEAGASVEGHIKRKWGDNGIVIELDRVRITGGWAPFYAELLNLDSLPQARIQRVSQEYTNELERDPDPLADLPELDVPGVATLTFLRKDSVIPAGYPMLWRTEALLPVSK